MPLSFFKFGMSVDTSFTWAKFRRGMSVDTAFYLRKNAKKILSKKLKIKKI